MYQLTREQKIQNLREQKEILRRKRENIEGQIKGIEAKIEKLSSSKNTSNSINSTYQQLERLQGTLPTASVDMNF